jgi:X-Pro dipeptidyl-peptidase
VPISAISNWYHYTRLAGARLNGWSNNYPSSLSNTVTNPVALAPSNTSRLYCSPFRSSLNVADGDENGDFTPFWFERDYMHLIDNVDIPVFVIHGLQDDNVKTNNFAEWYQRLQDRDVPSKLWLTRTGHEDPFDFRRAEWVTTLHRWFDRWLQDVNNKIEQDPRVDIEDIDGGDFETASRWPLVGTQPTRLWLRPGTEAANGAFGLSRLEGKPQKATFQDHTTQSENTMISNLTTVRPNRLVFISDLLEAPVRISGTALMELTAAGDQPNTDFGAALVDFGPLTTHVSRSSEGVVTAQPATENCWGESASTANGDAFTDDGCYFVTDTITQDATTWRVARGSVDGLNLYDYTTPTPLVPGQEYDFDFQLYPTDYVFEAGHQIAVVIVSSYPNLTCSFDPATATSSANTCGAQNVNRPNVTLNVSKSRVMLPIVGGQNAAKAAGF